MLVLAHIPDSWEKNGHNLELLLRWHYALAEDFERCGNRSLILMLRQPHLLEPVSQLTIVDDFEARDVIELDRDRHLVNGRGFPLREIARTFNFGQLYHGMRLSRTT